MGGVWEWEHAGGEQPLLMHTFAVVNFIYSLVVRSFPSLEGDILCVVGAGGPGMNMYLVAVFWLCQ